MNASLTQFPTVEGIGSVTGAPNLPAGFTDTFTSRLSTPARFAFTP